MNAWLTRAAVALTATALLVLGFFFFAAALIVGTAVALVYGVRVWWTLRKLRRAGVDLGAAFDPLRGGDRTADAATQGDARGAAIDGEYQVIERDTAAPRLPEKDAPGKDTPPVP